MEVILKNGTHVELVAGLTQQIMLQLSVMRIGLRSEARGMKFRPQASAFRAIKRDYPTLAKRTAKDTLPLFEEFFTACELAYQAGVVS